MSIESVTLYKVLCDQYFGAEVGSAREGDFGRLLDRVWAEELTEEERDDLDSGKVRRKGRNVMLHGD